MAKNPKGVLMIICEFCLQYKQGGECGFGLRIPRAMRCHDFDPGVAKFCSDPADFKGAHQIVQMATFFGVKGPELRKVRQIATREEESRAGSAIG